MMVNFWLRGQANANVSRHRKPLSKMINTQKAKTLHKAVGLASNHSRINYMKLTGFYLSLGTVADGTSGVNSPDSHR